MAQAGNLGYKTHSNFNHSVNVNDQSISSGYESMTKRVNPIQGVGLKNLHLNRQGVLT
jgi:hypothetical protein